MLSTGLQVEPEVGSEQLCPISADPSLPITKFLSQQSECLGQNTLVPGLPQSHSVMFPVRSGSSGGHNSDLYLQWETLCSPGHHLGVHTLKRCGKRVFIEDRGKNFVQSTTAFSSSVVTGSPVLFSGMGVYAFFDLPFQVLS